MDFVNQTSETAAALGGPEPMHLFWFILFFVLNFFICRAMSIKLVTLGYIRKHPIVKVVNDKGKVRDALNTKETTAEFKKLFWFWFIPIFGAASLIMLYFACIGWKYWLTVRKTLFLGHI